MRKLFALAAVLVLAASTSGCESCSLFRGERARPYPTWRLLASRAPPPAPPAVLRRAAVRRVRLQLAITRRRHPQLAPLRLCLDHRPDRRR